MVVVAYTKQNFTRKEMARLPKRYERKKSGNRTGRNKTLPWTIGFVQPTTAAATIPNRQTHTHTHASFSPAQWQEES